MKKRMVLSAPFLVLGVLLAPAQGAGTPPPQKEVKTVLTDLNRAVNGYKKYAKKREEARRRIENDVLTVNDRKTVTDQAAMYQARMRGFKAEAVDDLDFLQSHLGDLSQTQRDSMQEARESIKDAPGVDRIEN